MAAFFLGQSLMRFSDVLQYRQERVHYFHWVSSELTFNQSELHLAIDRAESAAPGDPAFGELRREFQNTQARIVQLNRMRDDRPGLLTEEMQALVASQIAFVEDTLPIMALPDAQLQSRLQEVEKAVNDLNLARKAALAGYLDRMQALFGENDDAFLKVLKEFAISGAAILLFLLAVIVLDGMLLLKLRQKNGMISRANDNLRAVVETSRDAAVTMDAEGRMVAFSRAAEQMFGLSEDQAVGMLFTDIVVSELPAEEMRARIGRWLREKAQWFRDGRRLDLNGRKPDGTTFPIEVGFGVLHDAAGEELLIASIRNVSDQTEREMSLMKARNEALQAERAKSRFLSAMSHEMRTPLNGVLASLDLMRETTQMNERQLELAEIIERCGDDALEQVENVLELTRLDKLNSVAVGAAPFTPVTILRDLVDRLASQARLNRNRLVLETELPDTFAVVGAERLFQQIMRNLISNALKFTHDGKVKVTLSAREGDDGKLDIRAAVTDTGIGIRADHLDRIFGDFETIRESYSRFKSGTGLGLSIVKHSAELMNGRIAVDSTPGEGSEFAFEVSLPRVAEGDENCLMSPSESVRESEKSTRMNILVVEDNQINRRMLVDMLNAKGHTVAEAADGLEGVSLGRAQAYDLILMDISMPKLDGVGATRMLREFGKCQNVPIVAVTAHAQPENMKEFLDAGMDQVLTKPLRMHMLDQLFLDLVKSAAASDDAGQQARDETETEEVSATMIDKDVFDGLLDMLDVDTLGGYIDQFEQDAAQVLPVYLDAVEKSDFSTARAEAHRCAGGAAVIGASDVHGILQGMTAAADASDAQKCRDLANQLPGLTAATMKAMRASLAVAG
ncbi:hybrid sensor histidine kinase/response regulator [Thalassovita mangrovi]|uniref:histidine kinase n=1 Tax=Thalassovita mangrovi TaxID=2692236 RepID=A0A6L8LCQ9_9RHOB|nr:ATP-binding protein [Thalassovita mangrovi]MYM53748.1 response regulator [Thalassovita mangrovi]